MEQVAFMEQVALGSLYRVVPGTLSVTPVYPTGQSYFTTDQDVRLRVKFTVERSGGIDGVPWGALAIVTDQNGSEVDRHKWDFLGVWVSRSHTVDDSGVILGKFTAGTLVVNVAIRCYAAVS